MYLYDFFRYDISVMYFMYDSMGEEGGGDRIYGI